MSCFCVFTHIRRCPLTKKTYTIGLIAVVALVALRLTVGWHFFYEGCWKVDPKNQFSAIPFLGLAKGPAAELFYEMLPDTDGATRLAVDQMLDPYDTRKVKPEQLRQVFYFPAIESAWSEFKADFERKYKLTDEQKTEIDAIFKQYRQSQYEYAANVEQEITAYFDSYQRFRAKAATKTNDAAHERQRTWEKLHALRAEVNTWTGELSSMGDAMRLACWNVLTTDQMNRGDAPKLVYGDNRILLQAPSVGVNSWVDFLNFSVTWALTAIGFCLITGFCNRLAALGGAAFLVAVLLTQPPWPAIYPAVHPEVGHAMIVDKNFVEMIACLVLASMPVGRWAGLDFFLWNCLGGKKLAQAYGLEKKDLATDSENQSV